MRIKTNSLVKRGPYKLWSKETCYAEASKYKNINEWRKHCPSSVYWAIANGCYHPIIKPLFPNSRFSKLARFETWPTVFAESFLGRWLRRKAAARVKAKA